MRKRAILNETAGVYVAVRNEAGSFWCLRCLTRAAPARGWWHSDNISGTVPPRAHMSLERNWWSGEDRTHDPRLKGTVVQIYNSLTALNLQPTSSRHYQPFLGAKRA